MNYIVRLMQGIKLASTSGVMVCGALQMMEHILLMDIWPRILKKYVLSNLKMMKAKLETYKYQMNAVQLPKPEVSNSQVVNVTNSVNVNVTFEQVRKEVEEMTSLTNEQTQEVLDKISEIEEVVKSKDSKKSKWEKVKPVLAWMADKSCDVGIALLPLLFKI